MLSHNKTLAAQLYREFKDFFPHNAVEYFVSYYDYYQPEAYVPGKDLYIEKDASINQEIERMRLSATTSLMERRDVIVVATVSCIYGLGNPEDYREMRIELKKGDTVDMREIMRRLVSLQYERNDAAFERSRFRVRGDVLEIFPSYARDAVRIEFFGDEIERIRRIDPLSGDGGGGDGVRHRVSGQVLRHAPGAPAERAAAHPRRAVSSATSSSATKASSWRRSGSRRAPSTTWRCWSRWGTARASRTTPGT